MKPLLLAALTGAALALPQSPTPLSIKATCTTPKLRKSWSKATTAEKTAYLNAAVCVTKKPSRLNNNGNSTLHDDFAIVHAKLFPVIHDFAGFLPWHRFFMTVYEKALHDCGYTGTAMYWDWVADSPAPTKAAVWDPVTGFGGNGATTRDKDGRRCVTDGPFKNYRPVYYNEEVQPHCLSREWYQDDPLSNIIDMGNSSYTPEVVNGILGISVFDDFRRDLEGGPHAAIHRGVGFGSGDMGFQNASPNGELSPVLELGLKLGFGALLTFWIDPLFFLHHTQVDRLWWLWQQKAPQTRTNEYSGLRLDYETQVSLNDVMPMAGLAADAVVKDYMNVKGGTLCYTY